MTTKSFQKQPALVLDGVAEDPGSLSSPERQASAHVFPSVSQADAERQARLLKGLANPTRLRLLSLLAHHPGQICVSEITQVFPLEQSTISHHLHVLCRAGLIASRRAGPWSYYSICPQAWDLIAPLWAGVVATFQEAMRHNDGSEEEKQA